ncbi:hypothetical protein MOTT27_04909 [Mycobacterium intracellulare subsp. yongonense]|nr:hypothetical protein MOTT27_04909 [Mycobacterium intracellulare subsp. yongonense]
MVARRGEDRVEGLGYCVQHRCRIHSSRWPGTWLLLNRVPTRNYK